MDYFYSITDKNGFVHSIDMVYIEYFSYLSPDVFIDILRDVHFLYPSTEYSEYLDRKCCSKYDYYLSSVRIGGAYVSFGKYADYDRVNKTFRLLPMFQIRFNPNKLYNQDYFIYLISKLLEVGSSGYLRKYDYSVDIPLPMDSIHLFDCRKEKGLFKGTKYFGQHGRHGFTKIYDKTKESGLDSVLTRVEQTAFTKQNLNLENIYFLSFDNLPFDDLSDTNKAIVDMYLQLKALGVDYPLNLGRRLKDKLRPYILGSFRLVDYSDILSQLLDNIYITYHCGTTSDGFVEAPEDLPFD